jgi:hypothetical protein
MRKLSDLVSDIRNEIREIPLTNKAVLNLLGVAVQEQVQSMIGTKQIFWQDLKPSTIKRKQSHNGGRNGDASTPLYDMGDFYRSIEYKVVNKNTVRIFSDDKAAEYHEYGTSSQAPRPVFKPAAMIVLKKFLGGNMISKFYLLSLR